MMTAHAHAPRAPPPAHARSKTMTTLRAKFIQQGWTAAEPLTHRITITDFSTVEPVVEDNKQQWSGGDGDELLVQREDIAA